MKRILEVFQELFATRLELAPVAAGNSLLEFPRNQGRKEIGEIRMVEMRIQEKTKISRQERVELAEAFLNEVLLKNVDSLSGMNERELALQIRKFCTERSQKGIFFETNVLLGRVLDHVDRYSAKFLNNGAKPPEELIREYQILRNLERLDLRRVDKEISQM